MTESTPPDPMLECAKACEHILNLAPPWRFPDLFVDLKMWFSKKYSRGLTTSTTHGIDFFRNVVGLAEGTMKWEEEGEYGDNFRKMVLKRPKPDFREYAVSKTLIVD